MRRDRKPVFRMSVWCAFLTCPLVLLATRNVCLSWSTWIYQAIKLRDHAFDGDTSANKTWKLCRSDYFPIFRQPAKQSRSSFSCVYSSLTTDHEYPRYCRSKHSDVEGQEAHQKFRCGSRVSYASLSSQFLVVWWTLRAGTSMISLILPPKVNWIDSFCYSVKPVSSRTKSLARLLCWHRNLGLHLISNPVWTACLYWLR